MANQEPYEVTAAAIVKVAEAFDQIHKGPLTRRAIVLLLQDIIPGKMAIRDIEKVLDASAKLKDIYVKKGYVAK